MTKTNQWITGNTAGFYLNTNENRLRSFRKDPKNKGEFRESKTSTHTHRMYEYNVNQLKSHFKTGEEVPDRLVRV